MFDIDDTLLKANDIHMFVHFNLMIKILKESHFFYLYL